MLLSWIFFTILGLLCHRHHTSAVVSAHSTRFDPPVPSLKRSRVNQTKIASPNLAHNLEEYMPSSSSLVNSENNCDPETETDCGFSWGCCPFPNGKCCDGPYEMCTPEMGICPCNPETEIFCPSWGCCPVPPGENWVCCEGPNIHGCAASQNDCP